MSSEVAAVNRRGPRSHDFMVGDVNASLTVSYNYDRTPGYIELKVVGASPELQNAIDEWAKSFSFGLGFDEPLPAKINLHKQESPDKETNNPLIPKAASVIDYAARWLELNFVHTFAPKSKIPIWAPIE